MLDLVIVVGLAVILLIAIAVRIDRSERSRGTEGSARRGVGRHT